MKQNTARFIRYSEVFSAPQGEGLTIGRPSLWIRLWGCNLECKGFSQSDPTNPESYELPYDSIDFSRIKRLEDLPVLTKGCDSAYSWKPDFLSLAKKDTAEGLAQQLFDLISHQNLSQGSSGYDIVLTGGEPLINQRGVLELLRACFHHPKLKTRLSGDVTIETNATKHLSDEFTYGISALRTEVSLQERPFSLSFSMSPKLFTTSGEKNAVDHVNIMCYTNVSHHNMGFSWLKFVVSGTPESWEELDKHLYKLFVSPNRLNHNDCPVYIMPVGASEEQQTSPTVASICDEVQKRGLRFSPRVQNYVYGNSIGK